MVEIRDFYMNLFKNKCNPSSENCREFLTDLPMKYLNVEQKRLCEQPLSIDELENALMEMSEQKSPGNDGLPPEFYKKCWNVIKTHFFASVVQAKLRGELSASQRQAIIRLIEKKDKDKKLIKNWRPISLLNTDLKIVSRALALRLKTVLPDIISSKQTAYVKDRFIGEGARLISDILEVTNTLNIEGYMLTIDFEKAFDSLNHTFIIEVLIKLQFPNNFIEWIKVFLNKQESCVINNGTTTKYFPLEAGARQGDPISAYIFIIAIEALFVSIEQNNNVKPLQLLDHTFLYTAYADDATFFLRESESIKYLVQELKNFSKFSGLSPNYSKCEVCAIGALKGAIGALYGFTPVDLTTNTVKILGMHFSYNATLHEEKNFLEIVKKMEKILQIWRMRSLTLQGKITVFKTLVISKLVYCSYLSYVPKSIIDLVKKMQKEFIWSDKPAKIKHNTMCNSYEQGGLQMSDIDFKIDALHLSWVRRFIQGDDHQWKHIPRKCFSKYSECFFPSFLPSTFNRITPIFYKNIMLKWAGCSSLPNDITSIYGQHLWNNAHFKINGKTIDFTQFREKGICFLHQLIDAQNRFKPWSVLQSEFDVNPVTHFQYLQLVDCIPISFKTIIYGSQSINLENLGEKGCWHKNRFIPMDKLISKELYMILIRNRNHQPTAKASYIARFPTLNTENWLRIYMLSRAATIDPYLRIFQYKLLNNVLYLNKKLHQFGKTPSPLCSFCNIADETPEHAFCDCVHVQQLWNELIVFLQPGLVIPGINPQSALIGFMEEKDFLRSMLFNHLLLIFKVFIYKNRETQSLPFTSLKGNIIRIFKTEIKTESLYRQNTKYSQKWNPIRTLLELG